GRVAVRYRRRGHRRWRHGVRRDQRRHQPEQRLRPDLPAARGDHPRRPRQHRRRARGRGVHADGRGHRGHLVPDLVRGRVLRGARGGAHVPAAGPVRPPGGEGTVMSLPGGPALRRAGLAVVLLAACGFPLVFTNQQVASIGVDTLIFVTAAVAWNIFSGYSGYISLGHAVFFGSGAYAAGVAARDWQITGPAEFALLPLAAVAAAAPPGPF